MSVYMKGKAASPVEVTRITTQLYQTQTVRETLSSTNQSYIYLKVRRIEMEAFLRQLIIIRTGR